MPKYRRVHARESTRLYLRARGCPNIFGQGSRIQRNKTERETEIGREKKRKRDKVIMHEVEREREKVRKKERKKERVSE